MLVFDSTQKLGAHSCWGTSVNRQSACALGCDICKKLRTVPGTKLYVLEVGKFCRKDRNGVLEDRVEEGGGVLLFR